MSTRDYEGTTEKDYVRILPKVTWSSSESRSPEQAGSLVTGPSVPGDQAAASPPTLLFSPASPTHASYSASQQSSIPPLLHSTLSGTGFVLQGSHHPVSITLEAATCYPAKALAVMV